MTADIPAEVLAPELFHREYLRSGKRLDNRTPEVCRPITATHGSLSNCSTSSLVSIGRTIVATKIQCTPEPMAPTISIHVSRAGVSSVEGATHLDKSLTNMINILTSRILPMDQLEIARPSPGNVFQSAVKLWGWSVHTRMTVLSDDGSLEVAAILSFQEALRNLSLPCFDLDEEAKLVENGQTRTISILGVSALRFAMIEGKLFYDPTHDEECVADGCCTVVMSREEAPKMMKMTTTGTFLLNPDVVAKMTAACCKCE